MITRYGKRTGKPMPDLPKNSQIFLYQAEDGQIRLEISLKDETVSLFHRMMAKLCQVSIPTINEHIETVHEDGKLGQEATIHKFLIV